MKSSKAVSARAQALAALREIVDGEKVVDWDETAKLSEKDQALFHQIVMGTLRNWRYLESCVSKHCEKPPKRKLLEIILLSSYQFLFLDRVPEYAVFAEAKALCKGLSPRETEFVHAILKKISENRKEYRERHDALLAELKKFPGGRSLTPEELTVLNATPELMDALKSGPQGTYVKAITAVCAMKQEQPINGWSFPWAKGATFGEEGFHVQGEASQKACSFFADEILKRSREEGGKPLRILEAAAGKGGKFLGTLRYLLERGEGSLPALEWLAVDRSEQQLAFFNAGLIEIQNQKPEILETVRVKLEQKDWAAESGEKGVFDLIWLDAPCSAFGTIGKHPEIALTRGTRPKEAIAELSRIQKNLILKTAPFLQKDGLYVYSVCTLTGEETTRQAALLAQTLGAGQAFFEFHLWPGQPPHPQAEGFYLYSASCK